MLHLYNLDKVKIDGLKDYKDYCIERVLSTGDKKLSFLYPLKLSKDIIEECYIRTKTDEFVVKELSVEGNYKSIVAVMNVEDLEGKVFFDFNTTNKTITECLNLALAGTGWTLGTCTVSKRRTVRKTNSSSWDIIQEAKKVYRVEIEFDTLNKRINIAEKIGSDKGVYFIETLNLKSLNVQSYSYDFFTKIYAIGKDDLQVKLTNNQYSNKEKTFIWKDERYTDEASLIEDATAKLNELSKPYRAYSADVIDLAKSNDTYKDILDYSLGDMITLISKQNYVKEKQRIVKIIEYPEESIRNSCEIANATLKFEDIQKGQQDINNTVNNITTDDGTIDGSTIDEITTDKIKDFETSVAKITDLTVVNAKIENLYAEKASIGELNAVVANVGQLNATKANITDLNAVKATISILESTTAKITDLTAINATIGVLEVTTASIETLLAGNLTGENIQAGGITSDKLTIANGFITNLMVANVDVSKLNAGTISTSKFIIKSDDGGIEISGATQKWKDKNNKVRMQAGRDAKGDFTFAIFNENGNGILIDHTGVKKDAIANDLIVSDMIAADSVGEKQLNYTSFTEGFNKDTNTNTLKSSKVKLDGTNQTLDIAFNTLTTNVNNIEVGGRNLLVNSGAEFDLNGWLKPETVGVVSISTDSYAGGKSFKISHTGTSQYQTLRQEFKATVNDEFSFSGYIKVLKAISSATTQVKILINCYNATNVTTGSYQTDILNSVTTEFKKVGFTIKAPANTIKIVAILLVIDGEALFDNLQLEHGNKITDWTPSPEDVDKNINDVKEITTSNSTTIGVQQGQITTAINNTQIVKDGQTILLKDDYSRTVNTVNSMNSTIGTHTSQINAASGKIDSVESKVNTVERDLSGTKSTVSSHTSQINGLNSTVGTQGSSIEQLKTKIELKVEETDITTAIDKIEIGGRNLIVEKTLTRGKYLNVSGSEISEPLWFYTDYINIKGWLNTITSGYSNLGTAPSACFYDSNKVFIKGINNNSQALTKTLKIPSNAMYLRYSGMIVDLGKIKLEKGVKSTDWTPAPEELESEVTTVKNQVATIDINLNNITSRVSSTESTTSKLNNILTQDKNNIRCNNLGVKINYSKFSLADPGELYIHGYDSNNLPIDENGTIMWNAKSLNITKGMINPNGDFGTLDCYLCTTATGGGTFVAYYKDGWKYTWVITSVGVTGPLDLSTNYICYGQFKMLNTEEFVYAYLYSSPIRLENAVGMAITETRLKAAEVKITDSAIISTVQATINTAKTEAINSANSSTDSKLTNYATTSSMNSAITQSATSIKQEVSQTYITSGNANNVFATKASMELTSSQLRLDFSSSGGSNILKNGGFRTGGINFWVDIDYGTGGTSKNRAVWQNNNYVPAGKNALVLMATNTVGEWGIQQNVTVKANTVYTLSFYISQHRCPAQYAVVRNTDSSWLTSVRYTDTPMASNDQTGAGYVKRTITFNSGNNIYIGIELAISDSDENGHVWIYDVMLNEGSMAQPWSPHHSECYEGNTMIDSSGVTISNGALRVKNNAGETVFSGDSAGNLTFTGAIIPKDGVINFFSTAIDAPQIDCRNNLCRLKLDNQNYIAVGYNATTLYSYNGRTTFFVGDNYPGVQYSRTSGRFIGYSDGSQDFGCTTNSLSAYTKIYASAFMVGSSEKLKTNITTTEDVDYKRILVENTVRKYNLRSEIALYEEGSLNEESATKLGFIVEELGYGKDILAPYEREGVDIYAMSSVLWENTKEQHNKIIDLENRILDLERAM